MSPVYLDDGTEEHSPAPLTCTGRVISCFNESAKLCKCLNHDPFDTTPDTKYVAYSYNFEHDHAGYLSYTPAQFPSDRIYQD